MTARYLRASHDRAVDVSTKSDVHAALTAYVEANKPNVAGIKCDSCGIEWEANSAGMVTMEVSRGVARVITDETVEVDPTGGHF